MKTYTINDLNYIIVRGKLYQECSQPEKPDTPFVQVLKPRGKVGRPPTYEVDTTPADPGFPFNAAQKRNIIVLHKAGLKAGSIAKKFDSTSIQIAEYVNYLMDKGEIVTKENL